MTDPDMQALEGPREIDSTGLLRGLGKPDLKTAVVCGVNPKFVAAKIYAWRWSC
jgi:hypothetical protein